MAFGRGKLSAFITQSYGILHRELPRLVRFTSNEAVLLFIPFSAGFSLSIPGRLFAAPARLPVAIGRTAGVPPAAVTPGDRAWPKAGRQEGAGSQGRRFCGIVKTPSCPDQGQIMPQGWSNGRTGLFKAINSTARLVCLLLPRAPFSLLT